MRLFFSTVLFFHHRPHLAGHYLAEHGMFLSRQVHIVGLIGQSYDCCTVKKFRARSTHCFFDHRSPCLGLSLNFESSKNCSRK